MANINNPVWYFSWQCTDSTTKELDCWVGLCLGIGAEKSLCIASSRAPPVLLGLVLTGSSSRGGDVAVYVLDINQPSSPTPFYSVLVSASVYVAVSTVFHSMKFSRQLFAFYPRSGELRTQKLMSHLLRKTELKDSPFEAWSRYYIAIHATLTARDFFLANFYPSGSFTCIFFQNLSPVLRSESDSCVGPQNKRGHPAWHQGFPCWVPAEYKLAPKRVIILLSLRSEIVDTIWVVVWNIEWISWREIGVCFQP